MNQYSLAYLGFAIAFITGLSCKFVQKNLRILILKEDNRYYKRRVKQLEVEIANLKSLNHQLNCLLNNSHETNRLIVEHAKKLIVMNKYLNKKVNPHHDITNSAYRYQESKNG